MSSASQLLFSKIQGIAKFFEPPEVPDLSDLIIEDSPAVYYQLYNGSTSSNNEEDLSGNNYDAFGATSVYPKAAPIRGGKATGAGFFQRFGTQTVFRDTSLEPDIPDFTKGTNWTLECVAKITTPIAANTRGFIWGNISNAGDQLQSLIYVDDTGNGVIVGLVNLIDGNNYTVFTPLPASTTAVYHIALVRDVSNLILYVNGVEVSRNTSLGTQLRSGLNAADMPAVVPDSTSGTSGRIDLTCCDVAGYSSTLSPERVAEHYISAQIP